jgi:hypothetical protein
MKAEHQDLTRYLEGELGFDALSPDLQAEARRFERIVAALAAQRMAAPAGLRERVMARVRAEADSAWRRGLIWVMTPRTVRLSPATAMLALAAALALMVVARPRGVPTTEPVAAASAGTVTRFVFVAPNARSVAVTGDFVGWDPAGIPLADPRGTGMWVAELRLEPGVHHYVFVVNGAEWRLDPNASQADDGFGQKNSVVLVPRAAS